MLDEFPGFSMAGVVCVLYCIFSQQQRGDAPLHSPRYTAPFWLRHIHRFFTRESVNLIGKNVNTI